MNPPEVPLEAMHATYNRLTQQDVRYKPFERLWWDFQQAGYTSADLELVVDYIMARNRKGPFTISLRLDKLLDDLARFEGYRGEADLQVRLKAARARAWKATPAEQARASMCHHEPVPPDTEPRTADVVVKPLIEALRASITRQV